MACSNWAQKIAGLSFAGLVAAGVVASSCAEAEGRFYIQCAKVTSNEECAECTEGVQLGSGSFNVAACGLDSTGAPMGQCAYQLQFVLVNEMVSSLSIVANHNDVETSRIIVTSADLSFDTNGPAIDGVTGDALLGSIEPDGGLLCLNTGLFGSVDLAEGEQADVIASVKIYGRTTGGLDVETPTQYISVNVYNDPTDCTCEDLGDTPGSNGSPIRCFEC